jgi:hypothetical protein
MIYMAVKMNTEYVNIEECCLLGCYAVWLL